MSSVAVAPRARKSFSRLKHVLDLPDLIDIQKASFHWFLEDGLRETIDDISPIEDYTGTLAVEFAEYEFGEPQFTIQECREKDLTYQVPLSITVRFVNKDTGEIREQRVFMGDFPMMTPWGTFIINGTERVIVTQLVRSPGAYLMEPKDATKQVFMANLMPSRGSWLEVEIDKKGLVFARIDRKRKLPITTLLRALPAEDPSTGFQLDTSSNEKILELFGGSVYIANTLEKDPTTREEEALIEVFKKQRPGEPPTLDNARNLLRALFFDPKRYDLTKVGRYKLNQRLGVQVPEDVRVLTTEDILALVRKLVDLPTKLGVPEDAKDYAAEAAQLSRDPIRGELDEYEDFGNRRLRTTGELIQEAFRVGLYRMERVVRERMTTEDVDTITPQTIINIRPVVAALKEFFGSSQLSQFMDQTNTLSGLTHRRRLSALGAGGLTRERAPIEVRDVHPTHYGRMCPIETPEGPNIGLIGSLASFATVSEFGFIQTPYRVVKGGKVTDEIIYLDAAEERQFTIAQASEPVDPKTGKFLNEQVLCRSREGEAVIVSPKDVEYMDVSPAQIVSVATALIPFLEHNDANRALMGANMQRQAVPLMIPQAPIVGTGLEFRAAVDTGDVVLAHNDGTVVDVDAERIVVEGRGTRDEYPLTKFMRSNQGTLIHQKPVVTLGDKVKKGEVLADGCLDRRRRARARREPPRGVHAVGGLQLRGRDRHLRAPRQGRRAQLDPHPRVRDRRALDEARRRGDHARHPEPLGGVAREPRRARRRAHRRRRRRRPPAGREGHAEGRDRAHGGGEADPRDLQGEGARGPRHLAQGAERRGRQGHRRQDVLARRRRRPAAGRQRARSRLRREEAQDRGGRQARRPPREQGRHLEDRPRGGHAVPRGRPRGRRRPEPARRPEPDEHRPDPRDAPRLGRRARRVRRGRPRERARSDQRARSALGRDARLRRRDGGRRRRRARRAREGRRTAAIGMSVDESAERGNRCSGKVQLYDGKSGEPFAQEVTVGFMYILKLLHLVDDKIHARSTGPYSLVTQQPLGGKAQFGGQRFGEMEVWALEAYGSAYTLQEMLTIKSDDTIGRVKAYEAIVKGENIAEPSIPESFKVLLKEMQSLALDVQVLSDEGREVEVREEDDELLRAAEELGIDLSPGSLRAAARQPTAEEVEEGEEAADEGGELVLAADEELEDVEEAPLEAGLADVEATDESMTPVHGLQRERFEALDGNW